MHQLLLLNSSIIIFPSKFKTNQSCGLSGLYVTPLSLLDHQAGQKHFLIQQGFESTGVFFYDLKNQSQYSQIALLCFTERRTAFVASLLKSWKHCVKIFLCDHKNVLKDANCCYSIICWEAMQKNQTLSVNSYVFLCIMKGFKE